jgi:hypothetical protein
VDLQKYLTFKVKWCPCEEVDEDTKTLEYGEEQEIDCFKYGKNIFVRETESSTTVSAQAYLVLADVKPKDLLDGQVVKSVNNYPESWDARVILKECLTWNE